MKRFYEVLYRCFKAPWDIGPRDELIRLVESGVISPGRAIDLGCGTGANAIYLAQHGFEVTGVDFAEAAIETARRRAASAGVQVTFKYFEIIKSAARWIGPPGRRAMPLIS